MYRIFALLAAVWGQANRTQGRTQRQYVLTSGLRKGCHPRCRRLASRIGYSTASAINTGPVLEMSLDLDLLLQHTIDLAWFERGRTRSICRTGRRRQPRFGLGYGWPQCFGLSFRSELGLAACESYVP